MEKQQILTSNAEVGERKFESPLRLKYRAEVGVIQRQIGGLEEIRQKLGLSQRKMAQLLLVDPSAWSRWVKEDSAPPHVFRALEWYMLLTKEAPSHAHSYWISTVQGQVRNIVKQSPAERRRTDEMEAQVLILRSQIRQLKWVLGAVASLSAILWLGLFLG